MNEAKVLVHHVVMVCVETKLVSVKRLCTVHIRNRNSN